MRVAASPHLPTHVLRRPLGLPRGANPFAIGTDDKGCAIFECRPDKPPCPPPPDCGPDAKPATNGIDKGCPIYVCQPIFCGDPPECPPGQTTYVTGYDNAGCAVWGCKPEDQPCGDPPDCGDGFKLVQTGVDGNGCATYACEPIFCPDPPDCGDTGMIVRIGNRERMRHL